MAKITVQNAQITVLQWAGQDYISLTDMASAKEGIVGLLTLSRTGLGIAIRLNFLGLGR